MEQYDSGAAPSAPLPPPYKDRSTGLTVFGALTILLGCAVGLFMLLAVMGQVMAARTTGTTGGFLRIVPVLGVYGILSVALIWLGIGSVMARRWARALLLISSWSWLVVGVLMLICTAILIPKLFGSMRGDAAVPGGAVLVATLFAAVFYGVAFVIMPVVWIFFYNSPHVKATCEARDPERRWTDACPLPVLGVCVWLIAGVPMMILTPLVAHGVMPCFGVFLTGIPGSLLSLAMAGVWALSAWLLYKLDARGWWLILIVLGLSMCSALLTYARHDMIEMYQLMGYPEQQIEQIQKSGLLTGNLFAWFTCGAMLPFVGYLLFIKKYMGRKS